MIAALPLGVIGEPFVPEDSNKSPDVVLPISETRSIGLEVTRVLIPEIERGRGALSLLMRDIESGLATLRLPFGVHLNLTMHDAMHLEQNADENRMNVAAILEAVAELAPIASARRTETFTLGQSCYAGAAISKIRSIQAGWSAKPHVTWAIDASGPPIEGIQAAIDRKAATTMERPDLVGRWLLVVGGLGFGGAGEAEEGRSRTFTSTFDRTFLLVREECFELKTLPPTAGFGA